MGTRGSELARTQSGQVADALRALGHEVELVIVKTDGDVRTGSLVAEGGRGIFAAALREALLAGTVDVAVHSLKDLPTAPVAGLVVGAVPERELPFDVLCARDGLTLAELPAGARVGTGSPRRAAQVRQRRPELVTVDIRGNVGTRLARVHGDATTPGDLDAVVLARAGLARLGRFDAVTEVLDLVPAAGQGALAVECRADSPARDALAALDHAESRLCVTAERAVLEVLQAGCAAPVGVHAHVVNGHLEFTGLVVNAAGTQAVRLHRSLPLPVDPEEAGRHLADALLAEGAGDVTELSEARASRLADFHDDTRLWSEATLPELVGRHVFLPRAEGTLAAGLRAAGAEVTCVPLTHTVPLPLGELPEPAEWVVVTSPTAVRVLADAAVPLARLGRRVAVVGRATGDAVARAGGVVDLLPDLPGARGVADAATLAAAFPAPTSRDGASGRVVVPGSALARTTLADGLRAKGWDVTVLPVYTTASVEAVPDDLRARWASGSFDALVVTAGSNARAVADLLGAPPAGTRVVAFGPPSAAAASELGFTVATMAATQDVDGLVDALADALEDALADPRGGTR